MPHARILFNASRLAKLLRVTDSRSVPSSCDPLKFPIRYLRAAQMKRFNRQKLDAVTKTRTNIFAWRGQFTPEFVA